MVREFYRVAPFPSFDAWKYADEADLRERASPYVTALDAQIPYDASIADVGCGTGQLVALLALRRTRRVVGVDFSRASLAFARTLKDRFGISNLHLVEGDVMRLPFPDDSFDYVFCNGVLHHTAAPPRGFVELARVARAGGFVTVGLYNSYGRIVHGAIRWVSHRGGARMARRIGDWGIKRMLGSQHEQLDLEKRRTWWEDQFRHPHESVHSANEVLRWFGTTGLDYSASLPPIEIGTSEDQVSMFPRKGGRPGSAGRRLSAFLRQLTWVWKQRWTGGYFLMVGRKPAAHGARR